MGIVAMLLMVQPCHARGSFGFATTIGGAISDWTLQANVEMEVWSHNITSARGQEHGAYLNHFWSAGGKGPIGTYIADRQLVRYYIDGEAVPSIEFEPAMACGSGIGYERLGYYQAGYNMKEPWGPELSNSMMGHSARSGGGWHNRFKVPFARSIRVTVQLPLDVPANASNGMFMILRGLEGDPNPLTVGSLSLPPIVPWQLRLRKFTTHLNHVQPLEFVDLVNHTSATQGEDSGGALLMTVLVLNPGPGAAAANKSGLVGTGLQGGATEGCFRAYTERTGPNSQWPGILLATGTEDYYDDAYTFESTLDERPGQHTFYEEDAGLSHVSMAGSGRGRLSSMFRLHHNDPLYFRGKLELVWRDGGMTRPSDRTRKCLLRSGGFGEGAVVDLTVDSWLYTWEQPAV